MPHPPIGRASVLVVLGAASLSAGCGQEAAPPAPPPADVVVAEPVVRDVTRYYRYSGTTASPEAVDVRARVAGVLEEQHFTASTDVEAGDRLFTIERRPFEVAVESARARVAEADANLELARVERDRVTEAFDAGAATEQEKLEREATVKAEEARLAEARARLDDARIQLGYTEVASPIDGRVGRRQADPGNLVGRTEPTVLTRVVQLDPIHVYFDVSERIVLEYLERGRNGGVGQEEAPVIQVARANDPAGAFPFEGRVDFVEPEVDAGTGTIRVRGVVPNAEKLLFPGLFVRIRAPYDVIEGALLVERDAVGRTLAGDTLMVVNDQNQVEQRVVSLGEEDGGRVTVLKGLSAGERYVVRGLQKARPGAAVNPLTEAQMEEKLQESASIGKGGGDT
ncbi:efflux RND transporter periplasmic adaptor subunit [Phycisphaera mikurensis]|uniref:Efflux system periplasmic linker protein n=1 Tax=Phycisphaera mikurensis (strain NBRC 102666 / KCTC 22515 / FYK2301M01) TaxID=1142394 RepID=I0IEG2_PHYMF|nr:efflux RND transporter periplasmic adaptor subunit [Phycisphaera mikurensis]MBB6441449.1 RND family efflux transporter MFP subunit [Phycisphaera mikurensis]BAM03650.1 efflux system periplasmic linker protein [Phycisphaera mikurensis NBRC 102666]